MERLRAVPIASSSAATEAFKITHPLLGGLALHIHLISDLDAITPHLRQCPVDLLIYDERGPGGIEAQTALTKVAKDVKAFAELWGPDFLFPMSRAVAILASEHNHVQRTFHLGRIQVRDVCVAPKYTAQILRWIQKILRGGIIREQKVGMALSGGGLEGFLFQIGVLHALNVGLTGRSMQSVEVFTGISSGSIAAALMAGKVPTAEVIRALHGKSGILDPLKSSTLYDVAGKNIASRIARQSLNWTGLDPMKLVRNVMQGIPTGFFKGDALKNYFKHALEAYGNTDRFDSLESNLYIGATDQDTFEHVVFGSENWRDVSISEALRASCALPPFFVPTVIRDRWFVDGQITKTCNLQLAVQRGCHLIIIIDPLKPLGTAVPGSVDRQGGVYAMIQTIKALVYTRFQSALTHVTETYPEVDFLVFQPDEECAQLMAGSPMRYRIRTQLIELAYRHTLRQLRERHLVYSAKFSKYGFQLRPPDDLMELEKSYEDIVASVA